MTIPARHTNAAHALTLHARLPRPRLELQRRQVRCWPAAVTLRRMWPLSTQTTPFCEGDTWSRPRLGPLVHTSLRSEDSLPMQPYLARIYGSPEAGVGRPDSYSRSSENLRNLRANLCRPGCA